MNPKFRSAMPFVVLVAVAGLAFAFVRGGSDSADEGADAEITLPPIATTSTSETSAPANSEPAGSSGSGPATTSTSSVEESSEPPTTLGVGGGKTPTTDASPVTQIRQPASDVENVLRQRYDAVKSSENLCDGLALLLTIPDPALILSEEFDKEDVRDYVVLWRALWSDLKASGPADIVTTVTPVAGVFETLLSDIEAADFSTAALGASAAKIDPNSLELKKSVADYKVWQAGNCPSAATFEMTG